ncbi:MAG: GNAT family N-acetyltransferase [Bacteroidetes bacterium]|nr:GNAT family N-acetyltransferase [Bacteroidota bacterium]MBM3425046.1 GNAT family N-acetyltransferase [Bacteroidota bacterium]
MQKVINEISRELLIAELNSVGMVRKTRKGDNEIYIVNNHNAPNIVKEIGRLREITFRASGGGTGLEMDLDEFDTGKYAYQQLIVWSPEDQEIVGGYRFTFCSKAKDSQGLFHLSTSNYFHFTPKFESNYLPNTIELGRSWVQPNFQPAVNPRKGLFALDNIWDGLGVLVKENPKIRYFFGKVTMYPNYDTQSRDYLLYFMHRYFPDHEKLMSPKYPLVQNFDPTFVESQLVGLEFKDAFRVLNGLIRDKGEFIPPLVNIYMNLSPTMKTFGTAVNPEFGGVEETGILVTINDIFPEKKERHMHY